MTGVCLVTESELEGGLYDIEFDINKQLPLDPGTYHFSMNINHYVADPLNPHNYRQRLIRYTLRFDYTIAQNLEPQTPRSCAVYWISLFEYCIEAGALSTFSSISTLLFFSGQYMVSANFRIIQAGVNYLLRPVGLTSPQSRSVSPNTALPS